MTLLRELQLLLERTYGPTGVNFEEFLLDHPRCRELAALAGTYARQISDLGRVFMRTQAGKLRLGIYYHERVITALEQNNPQFGLNDDNVLPFMVFVEELDHAVHAALKYREGETDIYAEAFVRNLELQAKVDVYLVLQLYCAYFNPDKKLNASDRRWLKSCVFDAENFAYEEPLLRDRYRESNRLGRRYVKFLERLSASRRTAEIRRFRALSYAAKRNRILALGA
jgi:hypothetical protein